jgi:hypothetical protein
MESSKRLSRPEKKSIEQTVDMLDVPGASKQSQAIEAYLQHARALQLPNHIVASFTSWVGSTRCGLELW